MLTRMQPTILDPALDPAARADLLAWRDAYRQRLAEPEGWWAVSNLAWLEERGASTLGGGPGDDLRLPARVVAAVARLERVPEGVQVVPGEGVALELDGAPLNGSAVVRAAGARLLVGGAPGVVVVFAERAGRWGVRVYDAEQAAARAGDPVGWFEPAPGWCVPAQVEVPDDVTSLQIVDVLGNVREVPVAARLHFELAGQRQTLLAHDAAGELFVNFRDASNGERTYGAGRFLRVAAPQGGVALLDFHRAYHPPCAHTPYAMCPLPPLANRLSVAIEAGECWPTP